MCDQWSIWDVIAFIHSTQPASNVVDPQQAAFLPHSSIGDSIITMQLLPRLLAHERRSALAVLCDFRKAYDTVDRSFLIQALCLLGAGPCFLRMLVRLLTGRRSRAHANGYLSQPVSFAAGVPQGCPLSPALYHHRPGTQPLAVGMRRRHRSGRDAAALHTVC